MSVETSVNAAPKTAKRIDYATAKRIGLVYMTDTAVNKINALPPLNSVFDDNNEIKNIVNYHTSSESVRSSCVSEIEYLFGIRYKDDHTPYLANAKLVK